MKEILLAENKASIIDKYPRGRIATMVILFLLAGIIRLYRIDAPGLLKDRDYTSAIFARSFYFESSTSVDEWRKEIAIKTRQNQPILELPITEFLVSLIYRVVGSEQIRFARLLTNSFWLIGGIFYYNIAKRIISTDAAVITTAFYLFVPLSILLSRSFQPDSLMMLLFLISLLLVIRYYEKKSNLNLVLAAGTTGLTLLYRPLVLFALFGAFIALAYNHIGTWKRVIDKKFLIYIAFSLLPTFLYYGYGIFIGEFLRWKVDTSFRPYLLLHREFWTGWLDGVILAVGTTALIGAILGVFMFRTTFTKALLFGLWGGYITFGLAFTMHIHTHYYYNAQLIPIVALSIGPLITIIITTLQQTSNQWIRLLPLLCVLVLATFFSIREVKNQLDYQLVESATEAREIGEIVKHSDKVVFLARNYGIPLQYYGEFTGAYWPRSITTNPLYRLPNEQEQGIEERLNSLQFIPEYFVITAFDEFNEHHTDLKEYLTNNCASIVEQDHYLIYGLCTR